MYVRGYLQGSENGRVVTIVCKSIKLRGTLGTLQYDTESVL